jgi:hypothetical protein
MEWACHLGMVFLGRLNQYLGELLQEPCSVDLWAGGLFGLLFYQEGPQLLLRALI